MMRSTPALGKLEDILSQNTQGNGPEMEPSTHVNRIVTGGVTPAEEPREIFVMDFDNKQNTFLDFRFAQPVAEVEELEDTADVDPKGSSAPESARSSESTVTENAPVLPTLESIPSNVNTGNPSESSAPSEKTVSAEKETTSPKDDESSTLPF